MDRPRRIAVLTTSRAEWGHLVWPLRSMMDHPHLEPLLYVAAAHLDERFGTTIDAVRRDGFEPDAVFDCLDHEDSRAGMGRTVASLSGSLARQLAEDKPDIMLVMADRYEMLAPASIATAMGIPIAHIEGGEVSEGALDQQVRDALTKLSHIHLVPHEPAAERVRALGEESWRVHVVGSPSLDHLTHSKLPTAAEVERAVGMPLDPPPVVVSIHPVTLQSDGVRDADALFTALERIDSSFVICCPNADAGCEHILERALRFCCERPNAVLHRNLDHLIYWGLLHAAAVLVGNSSSGIMETPAIGLPCVNIGDRQHGRLRACNIIDVEAEPDLIIDSIHRSVEPGFRTSLEGMACPYGTGDSSRRIADALAVHVDRTALLRKHICPLKSSTAGCTPS
ncbi:MAG: UDP-N-acetylglucosamine 2-epimerase [Phycisphaerales bacterium]|nr:UDP-N-acetylglucosamine 2-epimerase [Phycisphaerales bacterium]